MTISGSDFNNIVNLLSGDSTAAAIGLIVIDENYGSNLTPEQFVGVVRRINDVNPEDKSVVALVARWAAVATFLEEIE